MIRDYSLTRIFVVAMSLTGVVSSSTFAQLPGQQATQAAIQAAVQQARSLMQDTSYIGAARRTTRSTPLPGGCVQTANTNGQISYRCP